MISFLFLYVLLSTNSVTLGHIHDVPLCSHYPFFWSPSVEESQNLISVVSGDQC